jgi:maltooligosyltrehalose trehalohydrolase
MISNGILKQGENMDPETKPGATYLPDGRCRFLVWAPFARKADVHIVAPRERSIPLKRDRRGYHSAVIDGVKPGDRYFYRLDGGKEFPDPASRYQPEGVHSASAVIDPAFAWNDGDWRGLPIQQYVIYELHTGTFTPEGSFEAVIPLLDDLKKTGITTLELMPVAQFPGSRNWGYDGAYVFAVQDSYGGPEGLKRLVDACHRREMAVILDVVYNHFGPEGNYIGQFGPYFTDRYHTPWGAALNFDGAQSDHVRRFFIENAKYWLTEFHLDALRLDALHAIVDISPVPFVEELAVAVDRLGKRLKRHFYLFGESDANDRRLVGPRRCGGYGLDAQWNDNFHHALHALLTGERSGYYRDFGKLQHLAKAYREGFVYSGQYSAYRQRRYGSSSKDIPADRFVVFSQNHDQVGNRALGDRLSQTASFESLKLAAGTVLLSPFIPLIFMGEEYGETAPFQYFTSHSDPGLIEEVRKGRRREFAAFKWKQKLPDPQDESTFLQCKLNWELRNQVQHRTLLDFYEKLISLRKDTPALSRLSKENLEVKGFEKEKVLYIRRRSGDSEAVAVFNFSDKQSAVTPAIREGRWRKQLDSAEKKWLGKGSDIPEEITPEGEFTLALEPKSLVLFTRREPHGNR